MVQIYTTALVSVRCNQNLLAIHIQNRKNLIFLILNSAYADWKRMRGRRPNATQSALKLLTLGSKSSDALGWTNARPTNTRGSASLFFQRIQLDCPNIPIALMHIVGWWKRATIIGENHLPSEGQGDKWARRVALAPQHRLSQFSNFYER